MHDAGLDALIERRCAALALTPPAIRGPDRDRRRPAARARPVRRAERQLTTPRRRRGRRRLAPGRRRRRQPGLNDALDGAPPTSMRSPTRRWPRASSRSSRATTRGRGDADGRGGRARRRSRGLRVADTPRTRPTVTHRLLLLARRGRGQTSGRARAPAAGRSPRRRSRRGWPACSAPRANWLSRAHSSIRTTAAPARRGRRARSPTLGLSALDVVVPRAGGRAGRPRPARRRARRVGRRAAPGPGPRGRAPSRRSIAASGDPLAVGPRRDRARRCARCWPRRATSTAATSPRRAQPRPRAALDADDLASRADRVHGALAAAGAAGRGAPGVAGGRRPAATFSRRSRWRASSSRRRRRPPAPTSSRRRRRCSAPSALGWPPTTSAWPTSPTGRRAAASRSWSATSCRWRLTSTAAGGAALDATFARPRLGSPTAATAWLAAAGRVDPGARRLRVAIDLAEALVRRALWLRARPAARPADRAAGPPSNLPDRDEHARLCLLAPVCNRASPPAPPPGSCSARGPRRSRAGSATPLWRCTSTRRRRGRRRRSCWPSRPPTRHSLRARARSARADARPREAADGRPADSSARSGSVAGDVSGRPIPARGGGMSTWQRLEATTIDATLVEGPEARIADPMWMLGRQWQVGEFTGEDAASPLYLEALVRACADHAPAPRPAVREDAGDRARGARPAAGGGGRARGRPLPAPPPRDSPRRRAPSCAASCSTRGVPATVTDAVRAAFALDSGRTTASTPSAAPSSSCSPGAPPMRAPCSTTTHAAGRRGRRRRDPERPRRTRSPPGRAGTRTGAASRPGPASRGTRSGWSTRFQVAAGVGRDAEVQLDAPEYVGGHLDWYSFELAPATGAPHGRAPARWIGMRPRAPVGRRASRGRPRRAGGTSRTARSGSATSARRPRTSRASRSPALACRSATTGTSSPCRLPAA